MNLLGLSTLQRGIFLRMCLAMLIITLVIGVASLISQSPRVVTTVSRLGLSWALLPYYSGVFLTPALVLSIPATVLISVCYIYRSLDQQSQIVGMRSVGIGNWEIAKPALVFAAWVTLLAFLAVGFALPFAKREIKTMPTEISSAGISNFIKPGVFNLLRNKAVIYVSEKVTDNMLAGILVQDRSSKNKTRTYIAEKGYLEMDAATKWISVVMEEGSLQEVDLEGRIHQSISFSEYRFLVKPGFFGEVALSAQDQNIWNLASQLSSGSGNPELIIWEIRSESVAGTFHFRLHHASHFRPHNKT